MSPIRILPHQHFRRAGNLGNIGSKMAENCPMFSNSGRCILSKIDQDGQGRISVVTEPVSSISLYGWSCSVIPWGWRERFRRAISGPSRFGSLSKAIVSSPVCGGVPPLLSHSAKIQRTGRATPRNSAQSTAGAIRIRVTPRDGIAASRPREPLRRVQDFASAGDPIDLLRAPNRATLRERVSPTCASTHGIR